MTGFGEANRETETLSCSVEVRSVNHRYLKVSIRLPESHASLERDIERLARERVHRGALTINVRVILFSTDVGHRINRAALKSYLSQIDDLIKSPAEVMGALLTLPGVVAEHVQAADPRADWSIIESTLLAALERFEETRRKEGASTREDLACSGRAIAGMLSRIEGLIPDAIERFRGRLTERVAAMVREQGVSVVPADLVREVAIYVERSDIIEEITRLRSHLSQFDGVLAGEEVAGRKLEFLSQEMQRESNTIGSKANDPAISQAALELKSHVERVREIVQNVE